MLNPDQKRRTLRVGELSANFLAWPAGIVVGIELFRATFLPVENAGATMAAAFAALIALASIALSFARLMTQKGEEPLRSMFMLAAISIAEGAVSLIPVMVVHRGLVFLHGGREPFRPVGDWRFVLTAPGCAIMFWYLGGALSSGVFGFDRFCRTLWLSGIHWLSRPATGESSTVDSEPPKPSS